MKHDHECDVYLVGGEKLVPLPVSGLAEKGRYRSYLLVDEYLDHGVMFSHMIEIPQGALDNKPEGTYETFNYEKMFVPYATLKVIRSVLIY